MKFSIATPVWANPFTEDDLGLVEKVAGLGFDQLEIAYTPPEIPAAGELRDALDASGIGASVLAFCAPDRNVADAETQDAGIAYLKDAIRYASEIGADVVAGPIAHPPGTARLLPEDERAAERGRAIESLREVGEDAGEAGVILGVEVLSRYDSDMLNLAEQGLEACDEIGLDSVGLLLDTFHMSIEESSAGEAIRRTGDRLVHFHAVESHRGELGTGQQDWPDVFAALTDIGYGRAVSVESFAPTGGEFDGLVNMWRPWFDDPDEFAAGSLELLRDQVAGR